MKKINPNTVPWILITLIIIGAGIFAAIKIKGNKTAPAASLPKSSYLTFTDEVYDTIQKNYWDKISDAQLTKLYQDASDKLLGKHVDLPSPDKAGMENMMSHAMAGFTITQKNLYASLLSANVLNNLPPVGRSALYTQASQQALMYELNNVNPNQNLYADLGVANNATQEQIQQSYGQQAKNLSKQNTPAAKQKLAKINNAYATLAMPGSKQLYDAQGIQSTIISKQLSPKIFYMHFVRFSPTTSIKEFTDAINGITGQPDTLIFDLRGNIGGYLDLIPQMLGFFIGQNQIAYQFIQQRQYQSFNTSADKLPGLSRFKNIVILIDGQDESSTELLAGAMQKFKVGVLVGTKTYGWGTVENEQPFPIADQFDFNQVYSVHLVTNLTVVEGQPPIQDNGVVPDIDIGDKTWPTKLTAAIGDAAITQAVKTLINQ
jgi:curved DNA-binding protein CbpA